MVPLVNSKNLTLRLDCDTFTKPGQLEQLEFVDNVGDLATVLRSEQGETGQFLLLDFLAGNTTAADVVMKHNQGQHTDR